MKMKITEKKITMLINVVIGILFWGATSIASVLVIPLVVNLIIGFAWDDKIQSQKCRKENKGVKNE